jgi:hypothetical protein
VPVKLEGNMNIRKLLAAAAIGGTLVFGAAACSTGSSSNGNTAEQQQQQTDTTNLESSQPLPAVYYSQERQNLIDIELAEVNDVRTTSFVVTEMGQLLYSCPSIGFGIPDSASLSNPLQIGWSYNGWSNGMVDSGVVGQMDPNGIYAPTSSEGTWAICIALSGQPYINRFESKVDTVGGAATWTGPGKQLISGVQDPTAIASVVDPSHAAKAPKSNATVPAKK